MTQNDFVKKICLFGPQGSGKGTQSKRIAETFGVPHLSTGDIFRRAIQEKTPLGVQIEEIMKTGQLVPSELTNAVMKERIEEADCLNGFVLDGYPRNEIQADALDSVTSLTHVIVIDMSDEESMKRLSRRRVCSKCGATYHLDYHVPQQEGVCDECGAEIVQRQDDEPEAIAQRLAIYHSETEPLLARYEERGIVTRVDGNGTMDEVWSRVENCFNKAV